MRDGGPTVCISGVSPRTNFRDGITISSGQSRFNVSAAKRPLDAVLGGGFKALSFGAFLFFLDYVHPSFPE